MNRRDHKYTAIMARGGSFARCDICGDIVGFEAHYHEIFQRSQTLKGTEAREISYLPELCAVLCVACHTKYHSESPAQRRALIEGNVTLWGRERVIAAMQMLEGASKVGTILVGEDLKEQLRRWLLEYFRRPQRSYELEVQGYTPRQVKEMIASLKDSGLIQQVSGVTNDAVYEITDVGKIALYSSDD